PCTDPCAKIWSSVVTPELPSNSSQAHHLVVVTGSSCRTIALYVSTTPWKEFGPVKMSCVAYGARADTSSISRSASPEPPVSQLLPPTAQVGAAPSTEIL